MSFLKKLKSFFSGTGYKISREVLKGYLNEQIQFSQREALTFVDEFYLMRSQDDSEKLHVSIINYDVECEDSLEAEKDLSGIIIFVNNKKAYDPETDERFRTAESFIDIKLRFFPNEFILIHDLGEPASLEAYKIQ